MSEWLNLLINFMDCKRRLADRIVCNVIKYFLIVPDRNLSPNYFDHLSIINFKSSFETTLPASDC